MAVSFLLDIVDILRENKQMSSFWHTVLEEAGVKNRTDFSLGTLLRIYLFEMRFFFIPLLLVVHSVSTYLD